MAQSTSSAWIGDISEESLMPAREVYSEVKNLVVWNKTNAGQGSFYRSQHELIFVFKNGDGPHTLTISSSGSTAATERTSGPMPGVNSFRAGRLDELSHAPDGEAGRSRCRRHARLLAARRHRARSVHGLRHHHPRRRAGWSPRLWARARPALCRCRGTPLARFHQARCRF